MGQEWETRERRCHKESSTMTASSALHSQAPSTMMQRKASGSQSKGEFLPSRNRRHSQSPVRSTASSNAALNSVADLASGIPTTSRGASFTLSRSPRSLSSNEDTMSGFRIGDETSNEAFPSPGNSCHYQAGYNVRHKKEQAYRHQTVARRKNVQRQRRISMCLSVYIAFVTIYLFITIRQLQSGEITSQTSSSSNYAGPPVNSMLRVRDWIASRKQHKLTNQILSRSSSVEYPPLYPKITRTGVQLSSEAIQMCTRTLWHTLETTTIVLPNHETFVHTGDIDDLWLRDSAAQLHPLLLPVLEGGTKALIQVDEKIDRIVSGLIKRTSMYIRHDPYGNAFRIDDTYVFNDEQKRLGRHDLISTWNYELDSACYFMRLLYFYWKQSPNGHSPESVVRLASVQEAIEIMVDLWTAEQRHEEDLYPVGELFDCLNCNKPYRYPGLPRDGKGTPTNATSGMTWSGFRPSDDECEFGFLVPANMFAVVALEYVVEMAQKVWSNEALAIKAQKLAREIDRGIREHATVNHPNHGRIYAFEVDGLGNANLMDDANIPNLLSIPYLGYKYDPEIYENTRRFIFSPSNPEYRKGNNALTGEIEGFGSPHMAKQIPDNIWPMSIAMRGLTSDSVDEKVRLVEQLVKASAGTMWMHESFDANDPHRFTRSWFCWSDSLFAELVLSITEAFPDHGHKYHVLDWRDPEKVVGGEFAVD